MSTEKTIDEIRFEAETRIAHLYNQPLMYIGTTSRVGAASTFDGMMYMAHYFWGIVHSRAAEWSEARQKVEQGHDCNCESFADVFRRKNPSANEDSVLEFVRQCWLEVDLLLNIDNSVARCLMRRP